VYRDDSTTIDEHDRAVGAIQIADGLITDSIAQIKKLNGPERADHWRSLHAVQDDYLEIWRQLDNARDVLVRRGANTIAYDELGERRVRMMIVRDDHAAIDLMPLEDARRAVEMLRLAMPGADWNAIEARTKRLIGSAPLRCSHTLGVAGVLVTFSAAVATWAYAATPEPRMDPRVEARLQMRRELAEVIDARRARIEQLGQEIGLSCEAARAVSNFRSRGEQRLKVHTYMELLVMDGRFDDAKVFATDYQVRCGDDVIVQNWASLKKPRKRDLW